MQKQVPENERKDDNMTSEEIAIAKCTGHGCPEKDACWRYLAPAGKWQTYSLFLDDSLPPDESACRYKMEPPTVTEETGR